MFIIETNKVTDPRYIEKKTAMFYSCEKALFLPVIIHFNIKVPKGTYLSI